jgi:hypothetical protein
MKQRSSLPSTPVPYTGLNFEIPVSLSNNQQQSKNTNNTNNNNINNVIKNLTHQFTINDSPVSHSSQKSTLIDSACINLPLKFKKDFKTATSASFACTFNLNRYKSKSDTNLLLPFQNFDMTNETKLPKSIPINQNTKLITPTFFNQIKLEQENNKLKQTGQLVDLNESNLNHLLMQRRLTSFDIRETTNFSFLNNITKTNSTSTNDLNLQQQQQTLPSTPNKFNAFESSDILKAYFSSKTLSFFFKSNKII